jgi:hypothetical protein
MTDFVTPSSPAQHEQQGSPITVIPTSVICLQRKQIDSLETSFGSLGRLGHIVDMRALIKGGEHFYLDYAQLTRELPESIRFLKEWSCPAAVGCRVNLRHPTLISLILGTYGVRATAWHALAYAIVEARAEEVYVLLALLCGEVPCLRQAELSFDAGQALPASVIYPTGKPGGDFGATACMAPVYPTVQLHRR